MSRTAIEKPKPDETKQFGKGYLQAFENLERSNRSERGEGGNAPLQRTLFIK